MNLQSAWRKPILMAALVFLFIAIATLPASGGETLKGIKARDVLRCGVSEDNPGFIERDAAGRWKGLQVEFCRAMAAAVLDDSAKVSFKPLKASERFPALKGDLIDLLLSNTTWTLGREAGLKVKFPGVLFYDGQGFMVPSKAPITKLADLAGKAICMVKGTTHVENTAELFATHGWRYTPVIVDSFTNAVPLVLDGRCQALTGDISRLATERSKAPKGTDALRLLPERISKEPIAPVVRDDDPEWTTLVRWVLFLLVEAEEEDITRDNVQKILNDATNPRVVRSMDACRKFAEPIGIPSDWAVRVISAVGNYGEIFERTLGSKSPIGLDRGLNRLWSQGGLMYAPPLK